MIVFSFPSLCLLIKAATEKKNSENETSFPKRNSEKQILLDKVGRRGCLSLVNRPRWPSIMNLLTHLNPSEAKIYCQSGFLIHTINKQSSFKAKKELKLYQIITLVSLENEELLYTYTYLRNDILKILESNWGKFKSIKTILSILKIEKRESMLKVLGPKYY